MHRPSLVAPPGGAPLPPPILDIGAIPPLRSISAPVIELTRLCRGDSPKARWTLRVMLRIWREFLALPYWPYYQDTEKVALITYLMPGMSGHIYRLDGWERLRGCRAWAGGGTWSTGARAGGPPDSLWAYWLAGKRPANADAILARRRREWQALAEGRGRKGMLEEARRAA